MKQFNGKKITEFRKDLGLTQEALAIRMSAFGDRIYTQQISDWENKTDSGIGVANLAKLCQALSKSTDDFFTEA